MVMLPLSVDKGELSYPQAHAFLGKLLLWGVKHEAKLVVKNWLKGVAKKEGKHVALAAVKSLKALPNDKAFRLTVIAALAGGNYAQAAAFTKQRSVELMKAGANDQWKADKQNLAEHPEIAFQSFAQSAGDTVEGQWNHADDMITCGHGNVDISLQEDMNGQRYYSLADSPNDKLLTGRALLQRALYKSLMRNASFQSPEQARSRAAFYSHLACMGGKSRKVTAFMGGIAMQGKTGFTKLQDVRVKSLQFMDKMSLWAEKKL